MLHDVTIDVHDPGRGSYREVAQVDAEGGDDAVAKGMVEAARIAAGRPWKIVGVAPSSPGAGPAPAAGVEGEDYPDDEAVPDELEPLRRKPGRPRKAD